jgi:hypothetical protein
VNEYLRKKKQPFLRVENWVIHNVDWLNHSAETPQSFYPCLSQKSAAPQKESGGTSPTPPAELTQRFLTLRFRLGLVWRQNQWSDVKSEGKEYENEKMMNFAS